MCICVTLCRRCVTCDHSTTFFIPSQREGMEVRYQEKEEEKTAPGHDSHSHFLVAFTVAMWNVALIYT